MKKVSTKAFFFLFIIVAMIEREKNAMRHVLSK